MFLAWLTIGTQRICMGLRLCNWMTEMESICWIIANVSTLGLGYSPKHRDEHVCLMLPTPCLFPLNQPSSRSRLRSEPTVCPVVPGELRVTQRKCHVASLLAVGGSRSAVFIHSLRISWAFCPQSLTWPSYLDASFSKTTWIPSLSSQELSAPPISWLPFYFFGLLYMAW